jgi:hypothetical protein
VTGRVARPGPLAGCLCCLLAATAYADGSGIDRIYHPYVHAMEREVELRASLEDGNDTPSGDRQTWRLGYGQALNEHWFGELYLGAQRNAGQGLRLSGYEAEALWQITGQGEYPVDAGLLLSVEKSRGVDVTEASGALLLERDWGRWSGTANAHLKYEFGSDIHNEYEPAIALQLRYRYRMGFEPALEYYKSRNIAGLGPVALGDLRLGAGKRLHWEAGVIGGVGRRTPDSTVRLLLEYEF